MADKRAFANNPQRSDEPVFYKSAGRIYCAQRYVVGWRDGIVKVGSTANGSRRWGPFLARGATMLDLAHYGKDNGDLHAEIWLQEQLDQRYARAFEAKSDAAPYLGSQGAGYLECYRIPVDVWPEIIELARS
jgi:hypothetical protein